MSVGAKIPPAPERKRYVVNRRTWRGLQRRHREPPANEAEATAAAARMQAAQEKRARKAAKRRAMGLGA